MISGRQLLTLFEPLCASKFKYGTKRALSRFIENFKRVRVADVPQSNGGVMSNTQSLKSGAISLRQAFRIDEAAEILSCSKRLVYKMIDRGDVDALKLSNSVSSRTHMRVTRSSIEKFLTDPKRRVL